MKAKVFLTSLIVGITIFVVGLIMSLFNGGPGESIVVFHNILMEIGTIILSACVIYVAVKLPYLMITDKMHFSSNGKKLAYILCPIVTSFFLVLLLDGVLELIAPQDYEATYASLGYLITGMWLAPMVWVIMAVFYSFELLVLAWKRPAKNEL